MRKKGSGQYIDTVYLLLAVEDRMGRQSILLAGGGHTKIKDSLFNFVTSHLKKVFLVVKRLLHI